MPFPRPAPSAPAATPVSTDATPGTKATRRHRFGADPARPLALRHVHERRRRREGGHDRPRLRLSRHLDAAARQGDRADGRAPPCPGRPWRARPRADARRGGFADHERGHGRGSPRRRRSRRGSDARRASAPRASRSAPPRFSRASRRAPAAPWAAAPGCSRPSAPLRTFRRPVRHGVGHHERLHRHLEDQHHQSRRGRSRHRRGAARHGHRTRRRHPCRDHLQHVRARDHRLPPGAGRRLDRGACGCCRATSTAVIRAPAPRQAAE